MAPLRPKRSFSDPIRQSGHQRILWLLIGLAFLSSVVNGEGKTRAGKEEGYEKRHGNEGEEGNQGYGGGSSHQSFTLGGPLRLLDSGGYSSDALGSHSDGSSGESRHHDGNHGANDYGNDDVNNDDYNGNEDYVDDHGYGGHRGRDRDSQRYGNHHDEHGNGKDYDAQYGSANPIHRYRDGHGQGYSNHDGNVYDKSGHGGNHGSYHAHGSSDYDNSKHGAIHGRHHDPISPAHKQENAYGSSGDRGSHGDDYRNYNGNDDYDESGHCGKYVGHPNSESPGKGYRNVHKNSDYESGHEDEYDIHHGSDSSDNSNYDNRGHESKYPRHPSYVSHETAYENDHRRPSYDESGHGHKDDGHRGNTIYAKEGHEGKYNGHYSNDNHVPIYKGPSKENKHHKSGLGSQYEDRGYGGRHHSKSHQRPLDMYENHGTRVHGDTYDGSYDNNNHGYGNKCGEGCRKYNKPGHKGYHSENRDQEKTYDDKRYDKRRHG
ncbi:uncharacterized protein [Palaemon carinicauda]|uniref:uncharacterized protein n=1 Tax=Palaemon carinicauda TaxID=392227 RepID=UPI0035B60A79